MLQIFKVIRFKLKGASEDETDNLDTNAVRYFYQIECCNGEGVRDKVMKKYYFDKQKYVQFLRTVSSISIPATTKFELFFKHIGKENLIY